MQGAPTRSRDFLEGLSFVLASRQRETVLAAVIPGPTTPVDEILIGVGLDPSTVRADGWYPLRAALQALDAIEARFGDGTYETIRRMLREEARNFSSAKRLISRVIPFPLLLELSPNAYS